MLGISLWYTRGLQTAGLGRRFFFCLPFQGNADPGRHSRPEQGGSVRGNIWINGTYLAKQCAIVSDDLSHLVAFSFAEFDRVIFGSEVVLFRFLFLFHFVPFLPQFVP